MTFFMKFVFPVLWGGIWSYGTAELFTDPSSVKSHWKGFFVSREGPAPWWAKWVFLGLLVVGSFLCARVVVPLKRVLLEDGFLRISNYVREISVPTDDVVSAGFDRDAEINGRSLLALRFRTETEFGPSIEFLPRSQEAIELLRARLGPSIGGRVTEDDALASELRGRGTV
jgi:hypothetical protein